jgi:hypothetical protein
VPPHGAQPARLVAGHANHPDLGVVHPVAVQPTPAGHPPMPPEGTGVHGGPDQIFNGSHPYVPPVPPVSDQWWRQFFGPTGSFRRLWNPNQKPPPGGPRHLPGGAGHDQVGF